MGTKLKPGQFDCYASAAPDEPMFVLLARDPMAPILVRLWADLRRHNAGNPAKVQEALDCADAMQQWRMRPVTAADADLVIDGLPRENTPLPAPVAPHEDK